MAAGTKEVKAASGSRRTCAGCGATDAPRALVRVVLAPGAVTGTAAAAPATVVADVAGGSFGRGAHVHPRPDCLVRACRGGFARSFKRSVRAHVADLAAQIVAGAERRIAGLLQGARGAGALAIGADAACEALSRGAPLAVVACDAGSIVSREPVARAIADGCAMVWKDKRSLGELFGRDEVAILALRSGAIAAEVQSARAMVDAVRASQPGQGEV